MGVVSHLVFGLLTSSVTHLDVRRASRPAFAARGKAIRLAAQVDHGRRAGCPGPGQVAAAGEGIARAESETGCSGDRAVLAETCATPLGHRGPPNGQDVVSVGDADRPLGIGEVSHHVAHQFLPARPAPAVQRGNIDH